MSFFLFFFCFFNFVLIKKTSLIIALRLLSRDRKKNLNLGKVKWSESRNAVNTKKAVRGHGGGGLRRGLTPCFFLNVLTCSRANVLCMLSCMITCQHALPPQWVVSMLIFSVLLPLLLKLPCVLTCLAYLCAHMLTC